MSAAPASDLQVTGLEVVFETDDGLVEAVRGIDFRVAAGERLGFVGESGSGKTTTALALMGMIDPPGRITAGRAMLAGTDILQLDPASACRQAPLGDRLYPTRCHERAQPGDAGRGSDRRRHDRPQERARCAGAQGPGGRAAGPGRARARRGQDVPARAFRRHEAARRHRDRHSTQPEAPDRRRADQCARCDHPAPGDADPAHRPGCHRCGLDPDRPRHGPDGAVRRSDHGAAPRRAGRARGRAADLPLAPRRLHQGADRERPCPRAAASGRGLTQRGEAGGTGDRARRRGQDLSGRPLSQRRRGTAAGELRHLRRAAAGGLDRRSERQRQVDPGRPAPGLSNPSAGRVLFEGNDLKRLPASAKRDTYRRCRLSSRTPMPPTTRSTRSTTTWPSRCAISASPAAGPRCWRGCARPARSSG